jgi:hypothetical protein
MMFWDDGTAKAGAELRGHTTDAAAVVQGQEVIGNQLARTLLFSDTEAQAQALRGQLHINNLRNNPLYQLQHIFNNPDDPVHQAIRKNPALIQNTPEAQRAIEQAIAHAEEQYFRNTVDAKNKASMGLALMDPYSAFRGIAVLNAGHIDETMPHLSAEDRDIS